MLKIWTYRINQIKRENVKNKTVYFYASLTLATSIAALVTTPALCMLSKKRDFGKTSSTNLALSEHKQKNKQKNKKANKQKVKRLKKSIVTYLTQPIKFKSSKSSKLIITTEMQPSTRSYFKKENDRFSWYHMNKSLEAVRELTYAQKLILKKRLAIERKNIAKQRAKIKRANGTKNAFSDYKRSILDNKNTGKNTGKNKNKIKIVGGSIFVDYIEQESDGQDSVNN